MNKKTVLYTIIILLIIFFPLTIYSYTIKDQDLKMEEENPKHFPYYSGYLWFYKDNQLINKYKCENERCTYAYPVINQKYVFIIDGQLIKLYDINLNKVYANFDEVKKGEDIYLVKKDNLWGIYIINDEIQEIEKTVNENIKILNSKFVIKKDNQWTLKDKDRIILNNLEQEIVAFNNNYVICQDNNYFKIYDLNGYNLMSDYYINNYSLSPNYIALVIDNILYIYEDLNNAYLNYYKLDSNSPITIEENNHNLIIRQGNILLDTLAIP